MGHVVDVRWWCRPGEVLLAAKGVVYTTAHWVERYGRSNAWTGTERIGLKGVSGRKGGREMREGRSVQGNRAEKGVAHAATCTQSCRYWHTA